MKQETYQIIVGHETYNFEKYSEAVTFGYKLGRECSLWHCTVNGLHVSNIFMFYINDEQDRALLLYRHI